MLATMGHKATTLADYQARIRRAQALLEARMDDPVEPALLAREAAFSLHHFHRIFRGLTGESLMGQVRRLRLERAARRLATGTHPVVDLALEAGYGSHEAFTRAFAEHFGVAPSAYRAGAAVQREQQRMLAPAPGLAVEVRALPAVPVAALRHTGSYARVGETWGRLRERVLARYAALPPLYGLCPDDPDITAEARLRFDACAALPPGSGLPEGCAAAVVPGGTYAVAVHCGPYERLHETYLEVIGRWLPVSGREPAADPVVEHYLNDPATVAPADLRTEVRVRLED